ncbi:High affinity choline transporter 1 [Liparis tanakae]|uniref:High affinity choline transporter 1 n=1 Tax=Liparis tanakae TaxID=230148 RepID=A0A4Z2EDM8_9TELE|nr:High affinity choline transporter 1 [Liparis tanakae]
MGAMGYQCFHQRTLSATSTSAARFTCFVAAFTVLIFGIPPILIGAVAVSTGLIGVSLTNIQSSIILLMFLGAEISYILIFSQLVCVLFFKISNFYGAAAGWLIGLVLRLLCGEPSLGLATVIHFPGCTLEDGVYVQYAPVRTISMLSAFAANLCFSYLAALLFNKGLLPERWDAFNLKVQDSADNKTYNEKETLDETESPQDKLEPMIDTTC